MDARNAETLTVLRASPVTLSGLLRGVSEADAATPAFDAEDEWSIAGIVFHLAYAEQVWLDRRVRLMVENQDPVLPSYPRPDFALPPKLAESLADFEFRRGRSLAYLASLTPKDWARSGRHEALGAITVARAASYVAAHDAEHLAQIARRLTSAQNR